MRSNNTSGVTGLTWVKRNSRWRVVIGFRGKSVHVGLFTEKWDAICARKSAEVVYSKEPNMNCWLVKGLLITT